jgi:glutaredoxin
MKKLLPLALMALMLVAAGASAQLYRWVDQNGKVHYSDTPPPASAKNVERKNLSGSVIDTSQMPYEAQLAVRNFPVTLYTSPPCKEGCDAARALLNKRGIPFKEVNVVDQGTNDLLRKASGDNQVPVLTVGQQVQKGFEASAFNLLLDTAGYPKTAFRPAGAAKAATSAKNGDANKSADTAAAPPAANAPQ